MSRPRDRNPGADVRVGDMHAMPWEDATFDVVTSYHPGVQHHIAEMRIHLEAMTAHLDRVCDDWVNGVEHGMDWPVKIMACSTTS